MDFQIFLDSYLHTIMLCIRTNDRWSHNIMLETLASRVVGWSDIVYVTRLQV